MQPHSREFYRIILGHQNCCAEECFEGDYIGVDYRMDVDLKDDLPKNFKEFNKKYIPEYLMKHLGAAKATAGIACGAIYKISKDIKKESYILCPDGSGAYRIAEISGDYFYREGTLDPFLRHCRPVKWLERSIKRDDMSEGLQNASGWGSTFISLRRHSEELNRLMGTDPADPTDPDGDGSSEFALEKHLEDYLVSNWKQTELGQEYDIYEDNCKGIYKDGELSGQQFPTDTGYIDILAISKDKETLLVIELKKGKASTNAVGQILAYMGYIKEEIAAVNQTVKGVIIAFEDNKKIQQAISMTQDISFYKYKIGFKLTKVTKR